MNSYQRRQRRRQMVFGLRKLAQVAEKACASMGPLADSLREFCIAMKRLEMPKSE